MDSTIIRDAESLSEEPLSIEIFNSNQPVDRSEQ